MQPRTLILSDLHLGRPAGSALSPRALRPLWQGATHLILNGDTAEIHHVRYRDAADRLLLELIDLARADRVDVTLIAGNHDPAISDNRCLLLHGGSILVTHGDVLHPAIAPWSPAAPHMKRAYLRVLRELRPSSHDDLTRRLRAAQSASYEEWTTRAHTIAYHPLLTLLRAPRTAAAVLAYWRRYPHLAARFAARYAPSARFIVAGHSHRRGLWHLAGRTILNTGCFGFPSAPAAVLIENHTLTFAPITRRRRLYQLDLPRAARFDLSTVNTQNESASPLVVPAAADHAAAVPFSPRLRRGCPITQSPPSPSLSHSHTST